MRAGRAAWGGSSPSSPTWLPSIVCTIPPGAAAHDAEAATEALRLGHDQVLTAAAAHSGVKEVHWAAPAVVPRMLAVLAGRGVEVLHLGGLACQRGGGAAAAARSTTCHLLHRLAPSLHTLHLSSPFCARVGVQGDRALAALLGAAGTLPLLCRLVVAWPDGWSKDADRWCASYAPQVRFDFPLLKGEDVSGCRMGEFAALGGLCRDRTFQALRLPQVGPAVAGPLLDVLRGGGGAPVALSVGGAFPFAAMPPADWAAALSTTQEVSVVGQAPGGGDARVADTAALDVLAALPTLTRLRLEPLPFPKGGQGRRKRMGVYGYNLLFGVADRAPNDPT